MSATSPLSLSTCSRCQILRYAAPAHQAGDEVQFTSTAYFTSIDDVLAIDGEDPEQFVVEEAARRCSNAVRRTRQSS